MLRVISALRHGAAIAVLAVLGLNPLAALGADSPAKRSPVQFTVGRPAALAGVASTAPADLAADRIEFQVLGKRDQVKYQVRIVGYVKNVRGGRFTGKATARLQESINGKWSVVAQSSVPALASGQEVRLNYDRLWNTAWSFYPDYRLDVLLDPDYRGDDSRNNVRSRSGADLAALISKENLKASVADPNRSLRGDLKKQAAPAARDPRTSPSPAPAAPPKQSPSLEGTRLGEPSAKGTSSSAKAANSSLSVVAAQPVKAAVLAPTTVPRIPTQKSPRPPLAGTETRTPEHPVNDATLTPSKRPSASSTTMRKDDRLTLDMPLEKAPKLPQIPNSTKYDTATDADLVCWVEAIGYKDVATGKSKLVSFLDEGRVQVMVKNLGLTLSGPCKVAMVRYNDALSGTAQAVLPNKGAAKQALSGISVLPGTGSTDSKTPWLAMGDVPPLKPGESQPVWITLPASERAAIGTAVSQGWYRVMVDTGGDVKEGANIHSPGETNNWSDGFYVKEGPCIEDFQVENSSLMPGVPLRFWASVHGSSRWALEYDYPNSTLPKTLFDKDPVMLKPFPYLQKGSYVKLPWLPWPEGGPQLQFPKMTLTLVAWNSTGSRKDTRQLAVSLYEFDGQFQIVDAGWSYNSATKKVYQVWVKVSNNCDKDMKIGSFGDPAYGSMYVKCTILNPKGMVEVDDCPDCNSKTMGWYVEGETVSQGIYCADPNVAKLGSNQPLLVSLLGDGKTTNVPTWTSGPLPAKGTIGLRLSPSCAKDVVGMTHGTNGQKFLGPGGQVFDHKPEIRIEVVVHTTKQVVKLKKSLTVKDAPTTWGVGGDYTEEDGPVDMSRFLYQNQW
jgi:hypothetical protein